ncbi:MAG TPA: hypothetical protein PKJ19_13600 [Flavobacteriales bacterium]|nr:hypothetical protein [Flavobacteriales bacterium]
MITFQGELRERKDATFQTAHEPQSIAAREHNGQIRDLLPHPPDEPFEFSKDAKWMPAASEASVSAPSSAG